MYPAINYLEKLLAYINWSRKIGTNLLEQLYVRHKSPIMIKKYIPVKQKSSRCIYYIYYHPSFPLFSQA